MNYEEYIAIQQSRSGDGDARSVSPWVEEVYRKYPDLLVGPLLDIGSCNGATVEYFTQKGIFSMGLDIAPKSISSAIRNGLPSVLCDIGKEIPFPDKSFKTVTMFHTFEHVLEPEVTMKNIKRVLDGYLFVIVPFDRVKDEHMGHFNPITDMQHFGSFFKDFEIIDYIQEFYQGHLIIAHG